MADKMTDDWYRDRASEVAGNADRGENLDLAAIQVDKDAAVSRGTNPGAWVQAWIWVPAPVTVEANSGDQKSRGDPRPADGGHGS